ncbi:MAG: V-type ATPase subunit [Symbiobacteriaceae bacterium]|nr:V-type ATPase subunit [Symbiobacteriaceae bacterium]
MTAYYVGKAIMSKSLAKSSNLLTAQHYQEMMHLTTMTEVAAYLRSTHYAASLRSMPERGFSRFDLENRLRNDLYNHFLGVMRYDRAPDSFYRYLIIEKEITLLIRTLQMLRLGNMRDLSPDIPDDLLPYFSFAVEQLSAVRTFPDLLVLLRQTPYYELLHPWLVGKDQDLDHLSAEAALWHNQTERIMELIDDLPTRQERRNLGRFYHQFMELDNLRALYRLKAFTSLAKERASALLAYLPQGRLRPSEWRSLLETETQEEFLKNLQSTSLGRSLGDLRSAALLGSSYFGLLTLRLHHQNCLRLLRFSTEGASAFMALHMLTNIEVNNLIALIEGAHYRLDINQVKVLLVY